MQIVEPTGELANVVRKILEIGKERVRFIVLYGSVARGEQREESDIDICVHYKGDKNDRFQFRMKVLGELPDKYDVQILDDLPLFIQGEVLGGKLIFYRDIDEVYDVVRRIQKELDDFLPRYREVLGIA